MNYLSILNASRLTYYRSCVYDSWYVQVDDHVYVVWELEIPNTSIMHIDYQWVEGSYSSWAVQTLITNHIVSPDSTISGHLTFLPSATRNAILVHMLDKVWGLYELLWIFATRGITLYKIESLPYQKWPWGYVFRIELDWKWEEIRNECLCELSSMCDSIKELGSLGW